MRYVAFDRPGDAGVLHLAEMPAPEPAEEEVLVAVKAAGISRADVLQRQGLYPPPPGVSPVLGLGVAGTIARVGPGVSQWKPGDKVCALCNGGGYAEYVAVPQGQVLPSPEGWTAVEAATLPENAFTVYDNLFTRARLQPGETVLVHGGTSGIGTTALMFATALGSPVIVTAGSDVKCKAAMRLGAIGAIDYRTTDFVAEVARMTQGRGVDVVLDIVGGDYIARDLRCLALEGRVACIAIQRGRGAEIDLAVLIGRRATVLGSNLRPRTAAQKAAVAAALHQRIWPLLALHDAIVPVVDSIYPLDRAADAHARIESRTHIGTVVLCVT
ncbi:MAG: NAD(P)H-quinone oxidoreductase [Candidatus Tumulicola sp.]